MCDRIETAFSVLYSDGSGGEGVGRRWCWRDRRSDAETRARKDVQEAKENTQVTPNRSMSEAHGVWVFRGYSNTKGMGSRRSSIKGSDVAVLKKSKEMVVMTSERYRKMNERLVVWVSTSPSTSSERASRVVKGSRRVVPGGAVRRRKGE